MSLVQLVCRIPALRCLSPFIRAAAPVAAHRACWVRALSSGSSGDGALKVNFSKSLELKLTAIHARYVELGEKLSEHDLKPSELMSLGKEYASLASIVELIETRTNLRKSEQELITLEQESLQGKEDADAEMLEMAQMELAENLEQREATEASIIEQLTPRDENDERSVVLEVRSGTGGDEASLFAGELFKMYAKYAALQGWKWEELSLSKTEIGGFKEAQASVIGDSVFRYLKFESGTHRVQRVPVNDVKIQTSAAAVLVLPEVTEVECVIRKQDLKIDVFRSSGAGGQSVNVTESAVRMTHIPTGIVVSMQDERSQIQNRARALQYIRAKVFDLQQREAIAAQNKARNDVAGSGDRSDKVRTFNFPQDRVTDHRVGVSITGVERVLQGVELQTLVDALVEDEKKQRLEKFVKSLA